MTHHWYQKRNEGHPCHCSENPWSCGMWYPAVSIIAQICCTPTDAYVWFILSGKACVIARWDQMTTFFYYLFSWNEKMYTYIDAKSGLLLQIYLEVVHRSFDMFYLYKKCKLVHLPVFKHAVYKTTLIFP